MRMPTPWCVANEPNLGATLLTDWKERAATSKAAMEASGPPDGMMGFQAVDVEEVDMPSGIQARVMSRAPTPLATPEMVNRDIRQHGPESMASLVAKAL